jgi:2-methylcitrate dehydratase
MSSEVSAARPEPDALLCEIADYVLGANTASEEAWDTARHCLMDSLGCALLALNYPACTRLLGRSYRARLWKMARACRARRSSSIR